MLQRKSDLTAPFQSIRNTSKITGLAQGHIRELCKNRLCPFVMYGQEYRVNVPLFLRQLEMESAASIRKDVTT